MTLNGAIMQLVELRESSMMPEAFKPCFDKVIETISECEEPSVQRTGKWINCDGSEHWKCDKCGCRAGYWFNEENSSSWELDMSEWLSDFCPNCGARLEV